MNTDGKSTFRDVLCFAVLISVCVMVLWDMSFWMAVALVVFVGLPLRRKVNYADDRWRAASWMYSVENKQKSKNRPSPSYSKTLR